MAKKKPKKKSGTTIGFGFIKGKAVNLVKNKRGKIVDRPRK